MISRAPCSLPGLAISSLALAIAFPAYGQSRRSSEIVVTAPGGDIHLDRAEGLAAVEIEASGPPSVFEALTRSIPGISLQDAQSNPFQPNLVYHGFTISPLQGHAQGLAVYVDGARFNQPFGDTVQFDLLPDAAIERLDLLPASPVYGLNALGGALAIETKTGRSAPGFSGAAALGAYGETEITTEIGGSRGSWSGYFALQHIRDDGWRRFSPSGLTNGFADLGWDGSAGGMHVKLAAARTGLTGNGSAPVELLRADERAVFTYPDMTRNRFGRISLHPWLQLGRATRLEASAYWQHLRQRTLNGDAADIEPCSAEPELLCLQAAYGGEALLRDIGGASLRDRLDGHPYGVLNRSATRSRSGGVLGQIVDRRPLGDGENRLVIGASYDQSRTRFASSTGLGALTSSRGVESLGPIIDQPDGAMTPVSLVARTAYRGLFVSERLPLTSALAAEFGLRWNEEAISLRDRLGTALTGDHHYRRLNPGVQLGWRLSKQATIHVGYSEASRAPTPVELSCADAAAPCSLTNFFVGDPPLEQVTTHSLDAGGQGMLGRVEWRIAAYRATSDHDIQFVSANVRGRAFFENIGQTRRQGVDATLSYRQGALLVRLGYALTDATYLTPFVLNSPDNPSSGADGRITALSGDHMPGVPRHRALVSVDYQRASWSAGGDVQAASGQYLFGDEANLERPTGAYIVANVRGSARVIGPLRLFGAITNLFNRHYATFGTLAETDNVYLAEAPHASDPRSLSPGAPRRWLIGVRAEL